VIVHRSDGKRLRDLFEALAEKDGFSGALSDHTASLADQLRDAAVLVIASRIPPVVSEQYANLLGASSAAELPSRLLINLRK